MYFIFLWIPLKQWDMIRPEESSIDTLQTARQQTASYYHIWYGEEIIAMTYHWNVVIISIN